MEKIFTVNEKNPIDLPKWVRDYLQYKEGDQLLIQLKEHNEISIKKNIKISEYKE